MSENELIAKISSLPEKLKQEVFDFIEFLSSKIKSGTENKKHRIAGLAKGMIELHEDFDEPLEELNF